MKNEEIGGKNEKGGRKTEENYIKNSSGEKMNLKRGGG